MAVPFVVAFLLFNVIVVLIGEHAVLVVVVAPVVVPPTVYPVLHVQVVEALFAAVLEFVGQGKHALPTPVPLR